ncbi:MAG: hypothetical protein V4534_06990 [Myxococcota bacterium]
MLRTMLAWSFMLGLAVPSFGFFEEALKKFEEKSLEFLANSKNLLEVLIAEYDAKVKDSKPELSEQIAKEMDKRLVAFKASLRKRFGQVDASPIFTKEFKEHLATKLTSMEAEIDTHIEKIRTRLNKPEKLPSDL